MLYFACGSNLDFDRMAKRCPGATCGCVVALPHYRFLINSRGVASVESNPKATVEGLLWNLTDDHENRLDRYEGVVSGHYEKQQLTAMLPDESEPSALVYIATTNESGKPKNGYLEGIVKAARGLGFSPAYITYLES